MHELVSNPTDVLTLRRELDRLSTENIRLRAANEELRAANAELRQKNLQLLDERRTLQAIVDSHVVRAQRAPLFGPLELTAGTAVGPCRTDQS